MRKYEPPQPGFEPGYPEGNRMAGLLFQSCAIPGYATAALKTLALKFLISYLNITKNLYKQSKFPNTYWARSLVAKLHCYIVIPQMMLPLQGEGHRFESGRAHHIKKLYAAVV